MSYSNIFSRTFSSLVGLGMVICTLISAVGCTEGLEETKVKDRTTVSLKLDQAFQDKAYVRLNHDGSQDDYWFYALTQDFKVQADSLLVAEIAAAIKADGYLYGNVGTNKSILLEGLAANTSYRVVAARILADGSITGNVAELVFKTLRNPSVFEVHPEWDIQYAGRQVEKNNPDAETELFECTVGKSTDTYVPCFLLKSDYERAYAGNLQACFEDYVAFRTQENVKWPNVVVSGDYDYVEERLMTGEYVLFMIGLTTSGELTGYYAMAECEIEQEVPTEGYLNWVGKWTLTGECNGTKITYNVNIEPTENNLYYRMSGWEDVESLNAIFRPLTADRPILLYFEKSTGHAYVISEELEAYSSPSLADLYDFYVYGCVNLEYNGAMTDLLFDVANVRLARFEMVTADRAVAYPESVEFEYNGMRFVEEFVFFNYSYRMPLYNGLVPITADSVVPRIETIKLDRF